jgi:hypothetical protein
MALFLLLAHPLQKHGDYEMPVYAPGLDLRWYLTAETP